MKIKLIKVKKKKDKNQNYISKILYNLKKIKAIL